MCDPDRLLGELRIEEAARERSRRRWLRQSSEENSTFVGVLVDLAEGRTPVALATEAGEVRGRLNEVGADYCIVDDGRVELVCRLLAVKSVLADTRAGRTAVAPAGDRHVRADRTLHDLLAVWMDERPEISATVGARVRHRGALAWVGTDLFALHVSSSGGRVVHVPLSALIYVHIERSAPLR